MTQGVQIFDETGRQVMDASDRLLKFHSVVGTPQAAGGGFYGVDGMLPDGTWAVVSMSSGAAASVSSAGFNYTALNVSGAGFLVLRV
jgi:hypothetical protein